MFKFFFVAALIVCVVAEGGDHQAETKLWKNEIGADGWHSEFESSNNIRQSAHGDVHGNIQGEFGWVDANGEQAVIKYVADENGYQPEGAIIPTAHPIPEAILKAIEYINAHPSHQGEPVLY